MRPRDKGLTCAGAVIQVPGWCARHMECLCEWVIQGRGAGVKSQERTPSHLSVPRTAW